MYLDFLVKIFFFFFKHKMHKKTVFEVFYGVKIDSKPHLSYFGILQIFYSKYYLSFLFESFLK